MTTVIQSIWMVLSSESVPVCCENDSPSHGNPSYTMPLELFKRLAEEVSRNGWNCHVLASRHALPASYADICRHMDAELIVPNDYEGDPNGSPLTVVIDQNLKTALNIHLSPTRVILRVRQSSMMKLTDVVKTLLGQVADISLRHPELLHYSDTDLQLYQKQLEEIGRWLAAHGSRWSSFRVDCLTDAIRANDMGECDAGNGRMAVGPDGQAYVCPAFLYSGQSLGVFPDEITIPDRHLFTRAYSLTCKSCLVNHCLRCVYQNKKNTREYGVSAANVCKLAHVEQRARAVLAGELKKLGQWNADWNAPVTSEILDPFELIEAEQGVHVPLWRHPGLLAARPEEVGPDSMLDIIHEIQGIVRAAHRCVQDGAEVSCECLLWDTPLSRARRRTIEAYRDVRFSPDCPTIREIEQAILGVTEVTAAKTTQESDP